MKVMKQVVALVPALFCAVGVQAQSFNMDVNITVGAGAGVPSAVHGGAANQAGTWNVLTTVSTPQALVNLNGAATGVTLTSLTTNTSFGSTTNGLVAVNDAQLLLADVLDLGGVGALDTFTINGLQNGTYDVYVYAMAPDSAAFRTAVNVNASAAVGTPGLQSVGGVYAGNYALGVTHSLHTVNIATGQIVINTRGEVSFGSLAGIQIVLVPAPGAVAMLGLAGLVGSRRRRA